MTKMNIEHPNADNFPIKRSMCHESYRNCPARLFPKLRRSGDKRKTKSKAAMENSSAPINQIGNNGSLTTLLLS